ncbi:DUF2608 domain-containing protein [Candidatus Dependentiae bacterium]|nr:DUF2608 domain-containing protein [Candidatus Dependentiae bacterium]
MFSFKRYGLLFFILLFLTSCAFWQSFSIKEIKKLEEAKEYLNVNDKDILIIFDIDRTLLVPVDKILRIRWNPEVFEKADIQFAQELLNNFQNAMKIKYNYDSNYEHHSLSRIMMEEKYKLVEPNTATFIRNLQLKGIKIIALTSLETGRFGVIDKMGQWRYQTLKEYGIDFSHNFEFTEIVFDTLRPNFSSYPVFYKGILMTGKLNPKGNVLKTFFDVISWRPSKIYFFDDNKKCLESVSKAMQEEGIPFQGFWYKATFDVPVKLKLNREVIKLQYDYLANKNEYLTDIEAKNKLNQLDQSKIIPNQKNYSEKKLQQ